jgi:hypothetical protein
LAQEFREGDKQMDAENDEFAHKGNGTTTTIANRAVRLASY